MTKATPKETSRWWLLALVPVTGILSLFFVRMLPEYSDPRFSQQHGAILCAILVAGTAGLYGVTEVLACNLRRRTLLHPVIAFLILVLSLAMTLTFLPVRRRSADTTIIPELQLPGRTPSP